MLKVLVIGFKKKIRLPLILREILSNCDEWKCIQNVRRRKFNDDQKLIFLILMGYKLNKKSQ